MRFPCEPNALAPGMHRKTSIDANRRIGRQRWFAFVVLLSYAITFAVTDIISELYGRKSAEIAVRSGFLCKIVTVCFLQLCIWAEPADSWRHQEAYQQTFGLAPRILLGGLTAYLISQHLDVWIFHFVRGRTGPKHLWLRNNCSTLVSQFADTLIFVAIAFFGVVPLIPAIVGQYLVKVLIAAVDTVIVYAVVSYVAMRDGSL